MEEGRFIAGKWESRRILNGDELHEKYLGDMAEVKYVEICLHDGK